MGQKYHSKTIFLTKRDCVRAERDKLQELDDLERNPVVDICFMELFNHRLDYLQLTRNSEYYRDNKRLCKKTLKVWGNIPVSDVTKKMVSDLILAELKRCKKEGLTNSRPNKLFAALSATFNHAPKHLGLDLKNPCNGLSKLPEDRQIQFVPSEEMILAVKEACNPEQQRLITFVYETGCRIGEAINLTYN